MASNNETVSRTEVSTHLGEVLVEMGVITSEQLEMALQLQREKKRKLGDILIEQGLITPEDMAMALSIQLNMPLIDLKRHKVQPDALSLVAERLARKHALIPLDVIGDSLLVVMADPADIGAIEDVTAQAKIRVQPAVGIPSDIYEAIDLNYKARGEIQKNIDYFAPVTESQAEADYAFSHDGVADTPIVRTVDLLIEQALKERASDIHIEPQENRARIRYRIDGVLHDAMSLPMSTVELLISRVKVLAEMNIAERRRPQDGQFSIKGNNWEADIRAATYETSFGETVVMRILDKSLPLLKLAELGFRPEVLEKYMGIIKSPYGMILVAGPTGSGKTTTLYASLNQLDRIERNIITIEDPVEYRFQDIKQTQINPKAGITFSTGLRALMRLDPDIILVGEIRDGDTAKTAIQSALTGHLVLSSIHANDAVGVLFRLIDLGVERYLISSAMIGVVAQRMVRLICGHCREKYKPSTEELEVYEEEMGYERTNFYHGVGCNLCGNTGYLKRTALFEVLPLGDTIRRMFLKGEPAVDIKKQALSEGMTTLRHDGMVKVKDGITTIQEVQRNVFHIS